MADWFKFYENDIDEIRLQYAISKLPEVISVWVGILSEACRHKSGTVSWRMDAIELFGFSRRLNITVPKVNEAINLLIEIRYISKSDDSITVTKWHEKQSEYCQKRTKLQNQTGAQNQNTPKLLPTVSRQCPDSVGQEERRGEEIRTEEKARVHPLPPHSANGEVSELLKSLYPIYRRPDDQQASYLEESAAAQIVRRTNWKSELSEIVAWQKKIADGEKRFFPNSLPRLVQNWDETLDRARTHKPKRAQSPI